ncbi:MAG: hypothetical protein IPN79_06230 [Saprospiraceae bacterium]|nr:hypothetical protein [Saprospiraceae bacterium]
MEYRTISENGGHFIAEIDSKMFLYDVEGKLLQTWDATDIESVDVRNKLIIIKDKYPLMGIQNFGGNQFSGTI